MRAKTSCWSFVAGLILCLGACSSGGADNPKDEDPAGCGASRVSCNGRCIDPKVDPRHCGASGDCQGSAAGAICTFDNVCQDGLCGSRCGAGRIVCGGSCIDPRTDATHCGASGDCTGASAGVTCGAPMGRCAIMTGSACQNGQCLGACTRGSKVFAFTGQVEKFKLPACATEITVKAAGAQGGNSTNGSPGGLGAEVEGSLCVPAGSELTIVVGGQAPAAQYPCGGGGGTYVAIGSTALLVAGGGGGGYYVNASGGAAKVLATTGPGVGGTSTEQAGGGGGFSTDGMGSMGSGGKSFLGGGTAGTQQPVNGTFLSGGGFGGGGGASWTTTFSTGGGGGYDGGNAGVTERATGGSSFIAPGATQNKFTPGIHSGNGSLEISYQ